MTFGDYDYAAVVVTAYVLSTNYCVTMTSATGLLEKRQNI